jgi:hypothetical protein
MLLNQLMKINVILALFMLIAWVGLNSELAATACVFFVGSGIVLSILSMLSEE